MKILFLVLVIGLVQANSSFKEMHSSPKKCYETCKDHYPMNQGEEEKCSSCCTGCRFESIIGLISVDNVVQRDGAQKACYDSCEEAKLGETEAQCKEGCDEQLKTAEEELVNFDIEKEFSQMREMMDPLMSMFGNMFGGSDPFAGLTSNSEGQQPEMVPADVEPQKGSSPSEDEDEPQTITLEQILKEMGILAPDNDKQDNKQFEIESAPGQLMVNKLPPKSSFVLRDESEGDKAVEVDHVTYLKGLWRDRNTVQILLISSITACLFAILWMLCNSSNDPIVRRVTFTEAEEPPSYNVLYGVDEKKKLPILVVAGVEEQAEALPEKEIPLGFSTKI